MSYRVIDCGLVSGFLNGSFLPNQAWGSQNFGGNLSLPTIPAVRYGLWSGTGSQVGKIDAPVVDYGTLTSTTPGTTDLKDIDLQTALGLDNVAASLDEVVLLAILVDSTTDAVRLVLEPGSANGWEAPFRDMADPTLGKLSIPPGFVDPVGGTNVPGGMVIWGGNLASMEVTASKKVLRVRLVAGTTASYRLVALGRSAAS